MQGGGGGGLGNTSRDVNNVCCLAQYVQSGNVQIDKLPIPSTQDNHEVHMETKFFNMRPVCLNTIIY